MQRTLSFDEEAALIALARGDQALSPAARLQLALLYKPYICRVVKRWRAQGR